MTDGPNDKGDETNGTTANGASGANGASAKRSAERSAPTTTGSERSTPTTTGSPLDGGLPDLDDERDTDEVTSPIVDARRDTDAGMPPAVADLAAACLRFVTTRYKVPLDFTSDTLPLVDQYARDSRAEIAERPESLDLLAGALGAYFGEVMRREHGGFWRTDGDPSAWRLLFSHVFLSFNPIGMAREALTGEESEGFGAHLQLDDAEREEVEARLKALPDVDPDEFYLPTTRFEVVQIAVDALQTKMQSTGVGDVTFSPEDYD